MLGHYRLGSSLHPSLGSADVSVAKRKNNDFSSKILECQGASQDSKTNLQSQEEGTLGLSANLPKNPQSLHSHTAFVAIATNPHLHMTNFFVCNSELTQSAQGGTKPSVESQVDSESKAENLGNTESSPTDSKGITESKEILNNEQRQSPSGVEPSTDSESRFKVLELDSESSSTESNTDSKPRAQSIPKNSNHNPQTQSLMNDIYTTLNPPKKYLNPKWLIASAFLIALVAGVAIYFWKFHTPAIKYETITPTQGAIQSSISASGSLSPTNEVEIGSVISGIVLEVLVEENDRVQKGQILARINPETINQEIARYKAQLNSAKAQLRASEQTLVDKKWNYDRLLDVYESTGGKAPSKLELQNAKTAYTSARSDVDIKKASIIEIETSIQSASIDLKNSNIVTPIDGVILTKSVEVGQSVAASFQAPVLFKVAEKLEEMVLKANISEADIGKIKEGQEVSFSVDAYPDRTFRAKVNKVNFGSGDGSSSSSFSSSSSSSSASSEIVSYIARIEVDNRDLLLRPNMSATADIIIAKAENALLVPSNALYFDLNKALQKAMPTESKSISSLFAPPRRPEPQTQGNRASASKVGTLWVLEGGTPQAVSVEVGISDGQYTQILSGIDAQSKIITAIKAK